jgi:aspartate kinase
MEGVVVSGATIQKDMAKIGLLGIPNKPGNAARIFTHLAQHKVVVNDIIQTEISPEVANISFLINTPDLDSAKEAIEEIKKEISINDVFIRDDIAEVSVVGVGMRTHYGVAERMFGALAEAKVNIDTITTSEIRISCAVSKDQAEKALEAVCLAFELDRPVKQRKVN